MRSFFDFYDLHKTTQCFSEKFRKDSSGKCCRFCGNSHPDVSFETIPHIVPELFGRNNIVSNFECDSCNKLFQKYESDTSTMILHYLALLKIKTKKGIPIFQSKKNRDQDSTILKTINNQMGLNFNSNLSDFDFDDIENKVTVSFRTKDFNPYCVYKLFLKMGISLLEENEFQNNLHYLDFLNAEHPIKNGMQIWDAYRYMLKTKRFSAPYINLYKAKKVVIEGVEFPEYSITVNFANIIYQFFLPMSSKNATEHKKENSLQIELLPSFVLDDISFLTSIDIYSIDLSINEKKSITDKVVLYYQKRDSD